MTNATQSQSDLLTLATEMVDRAIRAGAHDAEVTLHEGDEFTVGGTGR